MHQSSFSKLVKELAELSTEQGSDRLVLEFGIRPTEDSERDRQTGCTQTTPPPSPGTKQHRTFTSVHQCFHLTLSRLTGHQFTACSRARRGRAHPYRTSYLIKYLCLPDCAACVDFILVPGRLEQHPGYLQK